MYVWDELAPAGPVSIYDKGVDRPQNYEDYGQFQLLTREGDLTIPKIKMEEPLKVQNRFFLQSIRSGKLTMNDGAFATDVVRVLEAIRRSLAADGAMTPVPNL
jgi:predicted dehydrogenase